MVEMSGLDARLSPPGWDAWRLRGVEMGEEETVSDDKDRAFGVP